MTYVCLLRGINVSGKNIVRMEALRDAFIAMGFSDVQTYVQSGNIVFEGKKASLVTLARSIEAMMDEELGCTTRALVLDGDVLETVAKQNPFLRGKKLPDEKALHVTFLGARPTAADLDKLGAIAATPDRFVAVDSAIYLCCPNGYGSSKLNNNAIKRVLRVHATTRNWKTVNALRLLARVDPR